MHMFGRLRRVRYIAHALLLVGLLWLIVGANATSTAAADTEITIQNFAFSPATITIPVGTTVVWTNQDSAPHTATADAAGGFDTGMLQKGQSGKITFNTAGTFAYHCTVHPRMVATIVVTGGASGTTAGAPSSGGASTSAVLPKTGEARDNRNWSLVVALIAAAAVIGGGAVLRVRAGKRVQE